MSKSVSASTHGGASAGFGSGSGAEPLLSLIDVTKEFRTRQGTVTAVDRVTFSMQRGRHLGVVGASGSGKSTVVKLVQKLLPATRGEILFAGADMTKLSGRALRTWRRKLQSVSQNPYASLFPNKTIGQNIIEPLLVHNIGTGAERKRKAESLMEKVGVALDQFYAFPHEISGGQQQRIAIARALALEPELLILDEAVSSLDVSIQAQILHLLAGLQKEFDLTYLFVSHNLAVVRLLCNEIAVMFLGRVVEIGPTDQLYAHPAHPYTRALLAAVPDFDEAPDADGGAGGADADADRTAAGGTAVGGAGDRVARAQVAAAPTVEPPTPYDIPSGCCYRTLCPLATEVCSAQEPLLRPHAGGGLVACHYPGELP